MAKKVQETRRFGVTQEVLTKAIPYALRRSGAVRVCETSTGTFTGRVPINWCSWGENLEIQVEGNATVRAQSRCSFPTQIIDWGKNRRNLDRFFEWVNDYIALHGTKEN